MNWGKLFNSKRNQRVFYVLASIVVFVTTYMLVLPALTIDEDTALQDPGISNETLSEEAVNELETVADPFTIEQEREAALDNTQEENTTDSSAVDSFDTQNTIKEETPSVTEEENTLSVSPDKDMIFAVLEGDFYLFDYKSEEIDVFVKAPIDAFPEGTSMIVTPIASEDVIDQVNSALDSSKKAKKVQAVDITFYDKDGNEIEPATEIKVSLVSPMIKDSQNAEVVHIDNNGDSKLVTQSEEDSNDDEIIFESKDFSTYVVVETEEISIDYLSADGNTYTITVDFDENAGIPEGSVLVVEELDTRSREYDSYFSQASKALDERISSAKVFDISIMNGDEEIEPNGSVTVTIDYKDTYKVGDMNDVAAVHFGQDSTEVLDVEYTNSDEKLESVSFSTDSFSIYAVVIIDKEEGEFVFEDEDYRVTVSYVKEANIPMGTELTVKEITPEEDQYWKLRKNTIKKINEGLVWEDTELTPDPRKGITDVAFFDISLNYNGEEIEPDVPLTVRIEYKNGGILVPDNEITQVIHFAKQDTELIEDVDVEFDENTNGGNKVAVSYKYEQSSFSVVGSYSTGEYIDINESNIVLPSAGIFAAPILRAAGDSSISAEKTITDVDGDGVYELALSVTGSSESSSSTTVNKSNVVLVIDTSGSMGNYVYTPYTYNASTYDYPNTHYYGFSNGTAYEVRRNNNNTGWRWVGYNNTYTGTVYTRQTRLEATKAAASLLVDALLANNKDEEKDGVSLRDIIEISLISFSGNSTYGGSTSINDATVRISSTSGNTTNATAIKNAINGLSASGGTNWEAALRRAKTEADSYASQTGESTSVIFLTDGMPTFYLNNANSRSAGNGGTGGEERDNVHNSWTYAADDARALVTAGYTLYNIFAFGTDTVQFNNDNNNTDADYLRSLTNYAYKETGNYNNKTLDSTTSKYFFNASDTTALQQAFNAIINSISNTVGYGGVTVDDGVTTGVTNTSVTVDGTVNDSSFHYTIRNGNTVLATVRINGNTATFTSPSTGSTATATGLETTVNINGTNHTNTLFTATLDGVEYKICPAKMDNKGEVVWELAPVGVIENGRTYEVSFDVWPNQYAYDMVADLNNGVKTLEQIKAEIIAAQGQAVWDQIEQALVSLGNGKYAIKTNYEQFVDYYTVDTTTNEETGETITTYTPQPRKELGPKDPVALTSSKMDMIKHWEDSLDEAQLGEWLYKDYPANTQSYERQVKLHVWKADTLSDLETLVNTYSEADASGSYAQADAHDYMAKTLGWKGSTYVWEDSIEVAPGTMIEVSKATEMGIDVSKHTQVTYNNKTYVILESGNYYTVTEENIERHFELNTIIYHPMLVDGVLSNVTFKENGTVEKIVPMSTVDATNTLKGGINILKRAFDGDTEIVATEDIFTVEVTIKNPDGTGYLDWDYRVYYGPNNPLGIWNGQNYGRSSHYFGTQAAMDSSGSSGQVDPVNGGQNQIKLDLYLGDTVRIINVPAGVTYSVIETAVNGEPLTDGSADNYVFNKIKYEISEGSADSFVEETSDIHSVKGNSSSQATVLNKIPVQKIGLKKIGDSNKENTLSGVTFKLYKDAALQEQLLKDALGNDIGQNGELTTGDDGKVEIGTLLAGDYYLVETGLGNNDGYNLLTNAVVLTVNSNNTVSYERRVSYNQPNYSPSTSDNDHVNGAGLLIEERTDDDGLICYYYIATVNNTSGTVLPHTGGNGTSKFYVLGSMLIAGSLMYEYSLRRNRKRKEVK